MSGCAWYVASFREISKRTCAVLRTGWMQVDPAQAKSVHRNDRSRIERGLEVFETTGEPISTQQVRICMCLCYGGLPSIFTAVCSLEQSQWSKDNLIHPTLLVHIDTPRALLNRRINKRCAMCHGKWCAVICF